jgi:hypothetical protein
VLELLGWNFVIRFRGSILVEHDGTQQPASQWLSSSGRARKLAGAQVTAHRTQDWMKWAEGLQPRRRWAC